MADVLKKNILSSLDFLGSLLGLSPESSFEFVCWFLEVEVVLKFLLLYNFEK